MEHLFLNSYQIDYIAKIKKKQPGEPPAQLVPAALRYSCVNLDNKIVKHNYEIICEINGEPIPSSIQIIDNRNAFVRNKKIMRAREHILWLILLIILGCNSSSRENKNSESVHKTKPTTYIYSNDTIEQKIEILQKTETEILFDYQIRNKKTGSVEQINGTAKNDHPDMDPEVDEDEEGTAYLSIQYNFKNNECRLAIRVSGDNDKVVVNSSSLSTASCPYQGLGVLKLKS